MLRAIQSSAGMFMCLQSALSGMPSSAQLFIHREVLHQRRNTLYTGCWTIEKGSVHYCVQIHDMCNVIILLQIPDMQQTRGRAVAILIEGQGEH